MTPVPLAEVQIIGCRGSLEGASLFDRAEVILRAKDGRIFEGKRWTAGTVDGEVLTEAEWEGIQQSGDAMAWPVAGRVEGAVWVWMLGEEFGERGAVLDAVERAGALLDDRRAPRRWGMMVHEARVPWMREEWARRSSELAMVSLREGKFADAARYAKRAWLMTPTITPAIVALLIHAHRLAGQEKRAEGYRGIERRAQGAVFDGAVEEELQRLVSLPFRQSPAGRPGWLAGAAHPSLERCLSRSQTGGAPRPLCPRAARL